nr:group-specific protein [Paenibacillus xylanexedens]
MLSISVDEKEIKKLLKEKVAEILKEADSEYIFWDASELKRRTCMSWNFIQDQFFFDPRFPKRKVGSKWYFPARETREFLEEWLTEQPAI